MKENQMQATLLEAIGKPLVFTQIDKPVPTKDQVLVKISHSGANPLDIKIAEGQGKHANVTAPAVIGIDMAGTVVEVGENVTAFQVGDEVYGMVGGVGANQGTLAEYIVIDPEHIALKPKNISMKAAAAMPLVFITAWEGLVNSAKVHTGQKVLIHGGAGGIGQMAVQIAQAFGADVYATGSGKDQEYLQETGAVFIDYAIETPDNYVEKHTNSEGFDIVFDTVGGSVLDNSFQSVKTYTGHVLSSLGWGTHSIAPLSFRGGTYSGIFTLLPLLTGKDKARHGAILRHATKLVEAGKLIPLIDQSDFNLLQVNEAYQAIFEKKTFGKVVINVGGKL